MADTCDTTLRSDFWYTVAVVLTTEEGDVAEGLEEERETVDGDCAGGVIAITFSVELV